MMKNFTVEEFKVLILRTFKSGNHITLQRNVKSESPFLSMNLQVNKCVALHNGVQFHVGGGYINIEFNDGYDLDRLEPKKYLFEFRYDDDRPEGYWLNIDEFSLFFPEKGFIELIDKLDNEVAEQREKDRLQRRLRSEADKYLDSNTLASIDNMLEK